MALEDGSLSKQEEMEIRRKKRLTYLLYIVVFIIFQVGVITLFSLTIMKFRTPKIAILSAGIEDFTTNTATATTNPSFNMTLNTEISVKNTNFGYYKYEDSVIIYSYNGIPIGEGFVSSSKVGWRATKKVVVAALLKYDGFPANPQLGGDLNSGVLMFKSQAKLYGKVRLLSFLFTKKKDLSLDCMFTIGVLDKAVRYITCLDGSS